MTNLSDTFRIFKVILNTTDNVVYQRTYLISSTFCCASQPVDIFLQQKQCNESIKLYLYIFQTQFSVMCRWLTEQRTLEISYTFGLGHKWLNRIYQPNKSVTLDSSFVFCSNNPADKSGISRGALWGIFLDPTALRTPLTSLPSGSSYCFGGSAFKTFLDGSSACVGFYLISSCETWSGTCRLHLRIR